MFTQMMRGVLAAALTASALFAAAPVAAQDTKIKFTLDWRFEGPSALFLAAASKGYFKQEKLDVTIDSGVGSGASVTRVATGAYEMGFADISALIEFIGNNPGAQSKPQAVYMVYESTPAAVLALKKSGIKTPADLNNKKLGAPVFDAGRKALLEQHIAAGGPVGCQIHKSSGLMPYRLRADGGYDELGAGHWHRVLAHHGGRCLLTAAYAGC